MNNQFICLVTILELKFVHGRGILFQIAALKFCLNLLKIFEYIFGLFNIHSISLYVLVSLVQIAKRCSVESLSVMQFASSPVFEPIRC